MERVRLIEHLIEHYVARDKFRVAAFEPLQQAGLPHSTSFVVIDHHRTRAAGAVTGVHARVVHATRESLKRCNHNTLDHLHDLLHQEPYLDGDEHVHTADDIFRYVIEEVDDRVPDLWTPLREASG